MSMSPPPIADGLVALRICSNGLPLDDRWQLIAADIRSAINELPRARLVIGDGDPVTGFPASESDALAPGATIDIALGYANDTAPLFSGTIRRQGIEIGEGRTRLIVEAVDHAAAMAASRSAAIFEAMPDSDLIARLIQTNGLSALVTATGTVRPGTVQFHASDWELMLSLARDNGLVVIPGDGAVTVAAPDRNQSPAFSLSYGDTIVSFHADCDEVEVDPLARVRGEIVFQGTALARPGTLIELAGLGKRFDGNAYVAGVDHHIAEGDWKTTAHIGLSPGWSPGWSDVAPTPGADAAVDIAWTASLLTGVVRRTDDPDGAGRVEIGLPAVDGESGIWARCGSFYASNGGGALFLPEVADEVLVGFLDDDPRQPVVLGSLYSQANPPPWEPGATNDRKAIVTRSRLRIELFEDAKAIEIATPGGQRIRIDDSTGTILLADANGDRLAMDRSGIAIDSASALRIATAGDVAIVANGTLSLTGTLGVKIAGLNIDADAQMRFSAHGDAEAKLTASGETVVQGAMVMIN
jgi:phage protein D